MNRLFLNSDECLNYRILVLQSNNPSEVGRYIISVGGTVSAEKAGGDFIIKIEEYAGKSLVMGDFSSTNVVSNSSSSSISGGRTNVVNVSGSSNIVMQGVSGGTINIGGLKSTGNSGNTVIQGGLGKWPEVASINFDGNYLTLSLHNGATAEIGRRTIFVILPPNWEIQIGKPGQSQPPTQTLLLNQ